MTMDVYFDYACPYCLKGFAFLQELSGKYPGVELHFIPVEAHPRPEQHGLHTDLCAQGMYAAADMGMDLWDYHQRMYKAAINDGVNIESAEALSGALGEALDAKRFSEALKSHIYADQIERNNHQAYDECGVWAVPSFILSDGRRLDAREGVGIQFKELEDLMRSAATPES